LSLSTWTSPEIDARIIALRAKGISFGQIAAVICRENDHLFVNKNMILRRSRTILGVDRGEKAANDRLERKRAAERAAREPHTPKTRPMGMPPPTVTLPPLASARCHPNTCEHECIGLGYCVRTATPPVPVPAPAPLGNGKCLFPKWPDNARPTHQYCDKQTPLGSSFCESCRRVCFYRARAA
jgi:hypothetical protein